jgi:hypothetical protein
MLELDYEILQGFEAGLGYFFNDETRFAEFSFETSGSVFKSMTTSSGILDLIITLLAPTVQVDNGLGVTSPLLGLNIYIGSNPTVALSFVYTVPTFLTWGSEFGEAVAQNLFIGTALGVLGGATITSYSDWLVLTHEGVIVNIGDVFTNNDLIVVYPMQNLTEVARSGSIVFTDAMGVTATVAVDQDAWVEEPIFYIYVAGEQEYTLFLDNAHTLPMTAPAPVANVTATPGASQISATFYAYPVTVSPSTVDVKVYDNTGEGNLLGTGTCAIWNNAMTTLTPIDLSRLIEVNDNMIILIGNE